MSDVSQAVNDDWPVGVPSDSSSPGNFIVNDQRRAQAQAMASVDDDPSKAARAQQLSDATGTPASIVYSNLENFETQHKAQLTSDLLRNNQYLTQFANSDPMAAKIASNDWGTLDELSQHLEKLASYTPLPAEYGALKGLAQSYGKDFTSGWDDVSDDEFKNHPLRASMQAGLNTLVGLGATTLTAPLEFGTRFAAGLAKQITGSDEVGDQVMEKLNNFGDATMMAAISSGLPIAEVAGEAGLFLNAKTAMWWKDGRVPPAGISPELDALKLKANQNGLQALDDSVKTAQQFSMKDEAPGALAKFVEQQVQDTKMGVSGQRVLELYGDKVPAPDDGILGWVPDIAKQLDVARDTGADVSVPMKDWIANVDPKVHKDLADDLRVVDGGITNNESKEGIPPVPLIDEAVPILRNNAGLEPLFSIGDRKLQLNKIASTSAEFGEAQGFHDFDMVNENGQTVGALNLSEQKGGKELYVDNINGLGDYYHPNNFGPALMRDLLHQIKAAFPNAETLTGHRVSGARGEAGSYMDSSAFPKIRLEDTLNDLTDTHDKFSNVLGGAWNNIGYGLEANIKPTALFTQHEQELNAAIEAERQRIAPLDILVAPVSEIRRTGKATGPTGLYYPSSNANKPVILWAMNSPDSLGTYRHEVVHDLWRRNFFTPKEKELLTSTSHVEGWQDKFQIGRRYAGKSDAIKLEESVADAYKAWEPEFEKRRQQANFSLSPIDQIFSKIKDFLYSVKAHIRRITGTENVDDLFQKVSSGEVRDRGPGEAATSGVAAQEPDRPISEPGQGIDVRSPFNAAKDVGMTLDQHKRYMKLIEDRQQSDLKASTNRILAEQTKRQSDEWKAQGEAMRPQVMSDLNARPDIAADKFFGLGELMGQKLDKTYRLDWDALTPEQRKAIPESYTVRKGGVKPDDVASLFGYPTGDAMINGLSRVTQARDLSGLRRDRFTRKMADDEIQRRMETQHGFLDKNILEDTKDQVLSENQLNLLHEETTHLAMMSGQQETGLTKDQLTATMKEKFNQLPVGSVSSDKFLKEAGKHGRMAELSLLQDKPADAYRAKQVQFNNTTYATFARQVEKAKAKLDKAAKPYRRVDPPKNIDPEYVNHIQDLLQQAGYKVGRSLDNIHENIERRGQTLEQFAESKLAESDGLRQLMIPDFILDGQVKPVDQMSTYNFMGFKRAVDTLIKNGKDEAKIIKEGDTADKKDILDEMYKHIESFPLKDLHATPTIGDKLMKLPRAALASLTSPETFLNRLGRRDANSVFNKWVNFPLARAAYRESGLNREFGSKYDSIGALKDKDKLVASPLIDPLTGKPLTNFTRSNVMTMIHNAGNKSNWLKFAKGWKADPVRLMTWLEANSTPEMWQRAQDLGKNVFNDVIKLKDQELEHMNGFTVDKIPLTPFTNVHGAFDGWYHPLIKDPKRQGEGKLKGGAYNDNDYGHITTNDGYTQARTGAIYPVDLNPDMIPVRLKQMLHDIAFQSTILETQKLFKDSKLSNLITAHYGANYNSNNLLLPYLKDVAGNQSIPSAAAAEAKRVSEFVRQGTIGTYVGFNPGTVMKHGATAAIYSMKQVGIVPYLQATRDLYSLGSKLTTANNEFVMKNAESIQEREKFWEDTISGVHKQFEGKLGFRDNVLQWGAWAVAKSDMASAKPTWLAAFRNAQDEGLSTGDSLDRADQAVRMAHGSVNVTNKPSSVRGGGTLDGWYTSLYGFFGTTMQRRIELFQDMNDTFKLGMQGDLNQAARNMPGLLSSAFTYVIWPTIIEELVTGTTTDDHRGWGEHAVAATFLGLSSSVLYLRDVVSALESGREPNVGLLPSAMEDVVKGVEAPFKHNALTQQQLGKTVGNSLTALGVATGVAPKTIDNAIHFGIDLVNKQVHPKTVGDWYRGVVKGATKERVVK
jgi:hypothetical protein